MHYVGLTNAVKTAAYAAVAASKFIVSVFANATRRTANMNIDVRIIANVFAFTSPTIKISAGAITIERSAKAKANRFYAKVKYFRCSSLAHVCSRVVPRLSPSASLYSKSVG
jgi:hypothetical protein